MSAIADFRIIEANKLDELKSVAEIKIKKGFFKKTIIDEYWNFLDSNSNKLSDFNKSGYIFGDLLIFLLENKGIDLLSSEYDNYANWISEKRENSTIIFTFKHKTEYLEKLNQKNFTEKELIEFNQEFSENSNPELAISELEGIKMIAKCLEGLKSEKEIILLNVGK